MKVVVREQAAMSGRSAGSSSPLPWRGTGSGRRPGAASLPGTRSLARRRSWVGLTSALLCLALVLGSSVAVEGSSVITQGPRGQRWVALTFDDGWSAERCESIVRTLRAKRATATFFINGMVIASAPSRWRKILKGFPVANHTRHHKFLTQLSSSAIRKEILSDQKLTERVLGRPMLKLMRPPYGAYDGRVLKVADSLGYRTILWSTSSGDTSASATTGSVIRNATRGGKGAIVLMHCGPAVTPAAVGPIIDSYRARGYKLVDLGEMLGATVEPPPPDACRVKNLRTGATRGRLGAAVRAARTGDRLTLRGLCRGTTVVDKDLTIRGVRTRDSGPPILDGGRDGSVLVVRRAATVKLRNLTIRKGAGTDGGGIRNAGRLTLDDVVVRANRAQHGGGVWNRAGATLRLRGSSAIRDNSAAREGGGVWSEGTVQLHADSAVSSNEATRAGGIWNARRGALVMTADSAVRDNTAARDGGGIWSRGSLTMRDASVVTGNEAQSLGGGGIYIGGGPLDGVSCGPAAGANVRGNAPDQCDGPGAP